MLALLAVIMVVQNLAEEEVVLLFFTVRAPRAILMLSTLGLGFAMGVLIAWGMGRSKRQSASERRP